MSAGRASNGQPMARRISARRGLAEARTSFGITIIRMFSAAGYLNQQSEAYQLGCFGCLPLNCKTRTGRLCTLVEVRPARQCERENMIDLARLLPKLLKATGT